MQKHTVPPQKTAKTSHFLFDTLDDLLQVFCEKCHKRGLSEHLHAGKNEPKLQMWRETLITFCKHILTVAALKQMSCRG